jgi:LacI family transcriptional regulator
MTMQDVAREAGVSVASVSRALSGARQVRDDVLENVQRAASKLGYQLDPIARALRSGRSGAVGLVVPDIASPFFPALASSLERGLRETGTSMFLLSAQNDPDLERECVDQLLTRRVDKILISPVHHARSRQIIDQARSSASIVQVDRYASLRTHRVLTDPRQTVGLVLDHMASQGCTRFAFVGAADSASVSISRLAAYRTKIKQIDASGIERTLTGDYSLGWGHEAANRILRHWPEVDAVVCGNDLIALGVIQELLKQGRDVPKDVAVTGCDDSVFSSTSRPSITSVEQPVTAMAVHAIGLLSDHFNEDPVTALLEPKLNIRESTLRKRECASMPKGTDTSVANQKNEI